MKRSKKKQIVIVGAGLIGSTTAIALASQGFDVTIVDGAKHTDRIKRNKGRTYALSRTSKNLLFNLGLWDPKKLNVSPIKNIVLSTKRDSNDLMRHLVEFNEDSSSIDPSSYMIEDFYLRNTLASKINKNKNIQLLDSSEVIQDETNSFETKIMLSDKSSI
ncbi:FAD-dependent monooxygenase, partial [Paracoccaceae bacterium]|nr:FAD-dependent monooxygenase [Paracoccaceae bacterium]